VPLPIQSGSITDRLRNFFRIRGKTAFALDEIVAPVVLVQDLTKGPYQAGVTPCAGRQEVITNTGSLWSIALLLNDKAGSLTPVLGNQFQGRSFSLTWAEIQAKDVSTPGDLLDIQIALGKRSDVVAAGVPTGARVMTQIQGNDGSLSVPVEMFFYNNASLGSEIFWRGLLGDNTNALGSRRTIDAEPSVTIGPEDAIIITTGIIATAGGEIIYTNYRGFYQEQPS